MKGLLLIHQYKNYDIIIMQQIERKVIDMDCPVCRVELKMSERQGIEIDYCPQCRGVWLDRGELDKIIERSDQGQPPRSEPRRESFFGDYDDDRERKRRKRGFLGELFD